MVLIQKCPSYDKTVVLERVREIFEVNGGVEKFAVPGKRVVIKPNLVGKRNRRRRLLLIRRWYGL